MSDMGLYEDPYDQELLSQYAMIDGQLPGAKPKDRLSFLNSMSNMLGFNPVALAGVQNPDQQVPQWTEMPNETGMTYGSNPLYASIFQAIDNGADPISAAKAAKDSGQFGTMTDADFNRNVDIATKYAGENAAQVSAKTKFEAENADKIGGYTAPDGSKYKQSPMGGNDINGWASEYDLLGRPDAGQLVSEYAKTAKRNPKLSKAEQADSIEKGSYTSGMRGGPSYDLGTGSGWHYTNPDDQKAAEARSRAAQAPSPNAGTGMFYDHGKGTSGVDRAELDFQAKRSANKTAQGRVTQSKNTKVRSDANTNAMRRVAALLTMIQGSAS